MRTTRLLAGAALVAATSLAWLSPASAQSASPSITVSPATDVAPGSMVTVNGSGFAAGGGVYVMFCAKPTGPVGTAQGRAATCNPDQQNDHTVWKTPIPADGTFSVQLKVESSFGSTNCGTTECGVFIRKDHMGGASDYSQDAYAKVAFAAAQATPSTTAPSATEEPAQEPAVEAVQESAPGAEPAELATTGGTLTLAAVGALVLALGGVLLTVARRNQDA